MEMDIWKRRMIKRKLMITLEVRNKKFDKHLGKE